MENIENINVKNNEFTTLRVRKEVVERVKRFKTHEDKNLSDTLERILGAYEAQMK